MTDAETVPGSVFQLIYRSTSRIGPEDRKQELGALFSIARSRNKERHITGALLCTDDTFVQLLEGDEAAVRAVFDRISRDPRHDAVALLASGLVADRVFSRWAMAEVADDGSSDTPLIAHTDGISPAAGRRTTPEQDRVLGLMRVAARGPARTA
jgi:hypothetical protein